MTWPHPVVSLSTELAHRCRRCAYETDVAVYLVDNEVVHVVIIEVHDSDFAVRVSFFGNFDQLLTCCNPSFFSEFIGIGTILKFLQGGSSGLVQDVGNVGHALEESDGQARYRELFFVAHGPVSVFQVVVLRRAEFLDASVSAVVVRYEESFVRNHLTCTSAAELYDSVFQ